MQKTSVSVLHLIFLLIQQDNVAMANGLKNLYQVLHLYYRVLHKLHLIKFTNYSRKWHWKAEGTVQLVLVEECTCSAESSVL